MFKRNAIQVISFKNKNLKELRMIYRISIQSEGKHIFVFEKSWIVTIQFLNHLRKAMGTV